MSHRPLGLTLCVCDSIIVDRFTGKKTLVGLFNEIGATSFPCTHHNTAVYVAMTDGHGHGMSELRFMYESDPEEVLFSAKGPLQFADPIEIKEMIFTFPLLRFKSAGTYRFDFLFEDILVFSRTLLVREQKTIEGGHKQ